MLNAESIMYQGLNSCFLLQKKKNCNNIKVVALVDVKCYNKKWGNKFVQKKNSIAINSKFNENFDEIIYMLFH